jgi:hypothetical protein
VLPGVDGPGFCPQDQRVFRFVRHGQVRTRAGLAKRDGVFQLARQDHSAYLDERPTTRIFSPPRALPAAYRPYSLDTASWSYLTPVCESRWQIF